MPLGNLGTSKSMVDPDLAGLTPNPPSLESSYQKPEGWSLAKITQQLYANLNFTF